MPEKATEVSSREKDREKTSKSEVIACILADVLDSANDQNADWLRGALTQAAKPYLKCHPHGYGASAIEIGPLEIGTYASERDAKLDGNPNNISFHHFTRDSAVHDAAKAVRETADTKGDINSALSALESAISKA